MTDIIVVGLIALTSVSIYILLLVFARFIAQH